MTEIEGTWLTLAEIAKLRGVTRQSISQQVRRLADQGLLSKRPGKAGAVLVNLAEFDRAIGDATDLAAVAGNAARKASERSSVADHPDSASKTYTAEQARLAGYKADLASLDLDERLGKLVRVDRVEEAAKAIAARLVTSLDRLSGRADEIAAAVARDGSAGARGMLKAVARDLRAGITEDLVRLVSAAAGFDPEASHDDPDGSADDVQLQA